MPKQDDVYIINEEDILDSFRKGEGNRTALRGVPSGDEGDEGERDKTSTRTRRKSSARRGGTRPLVASTLSMLVCGLGQAYNGQGKLGLLLFLTELLALVGHWSVIKMWPTLKDFGYIFAIGEWEIFLFLAVADFLLVFLLLYNIAQAYHQAEMEGYRFEGFRQPVLSGLASLLLPGWGQLLNAQLGKALFFLFCLLTEIYVVTLLMLSPFYRFLAEMDANRFLTRRATLAGMGIVFFTSLMWLLSVYDAFLVARYRRHAV